MRLACFELISTVHDLRNCDLCRAPACLQQNLQVPKQTTLCSSMHHLSKPAEHDGHLVGPANGQLFLFYTTIVNFIANMTICSCLCPTKCWTIPPWPLKAVLLIKVKTVGQAVSKCYQRDTLGEFVQIAPA